LSSRVQGDSLLAQARLHHAGVADLCLRHLAQEAGAARVVLARRQVVVEVGAVELVLPVGEQQLRLRLDARSGR
jgi:hypothetical protein